MPTHLARVDAGLELPPGLGNNLWVVRPQRAPQEVVRNGIELSLRPLAWVVVPLEGTAITNMPISFPISSSQRAAAE